MVTQRPVLTQGRREDYPVSSDRKGRITISSFRLHQSGLKMIVELYLK